MTFKTKGFILYIEIKLQVIFLYKIIPEFHIGGLKMASKVLRSNLAHKRLASKYDKISVSLKDSTAKQFWSVVKRDYHNDICLKQ